ncbi:beta-ketoacyl-ACP synthase 3 [Aerococcaceae bacterium zg-ZJ1578]|uniref:beta-ketoacyl-ACP synthase 3 n=1 Tax=Aerococcaceae bacterium zg-252 TaxID=2796928 RepID=UPI001A18C5A0|nr:beta-ketoacyl-ACP synthase 3 [Aerococcaceae bacterium zg-1578]
MSQIIKVSSYLPNNSLNNHQLINQYQLDSSNEWIQQRTGIKQRYFADDEETVANMAIKAAQNLLQDCDASIINKIGLIIVASMSSKLPTPSVANQVQAAIQANNAWGFDINGACAAFVKGIDIAEKFARVYEDTYTLLIGVEKMSDILDFTDRSSCILFGDGAGAILIHNDASSFTHYRSELYAIGDTMGAIELNRQTDELMSMKGRDVFNFVSRNVIRSLKTFIETDEQASELIICHQANQRLIDLVIKKLSVNPEIVPSNIAQVANLSAASIPVLMHQLNTEHRLRFDGTQHITLCAFGGGLAWGNISLTV